MAVVETVFVRCKKCPYALGLVNPVGIPCKHCRTNDFIMYDVFRRQINRSDSVLEVQQKA
jgi:hypothetical protein